MTLMQIGDIKSKMLTSDFLLVGEEKVSPTRQYKFFVSIIQSRKWTRLVHRFWPSYNQFNIVPPIILVIYDRIISTPSGESGLWLIVLILYSYHLSYKNTSYDFELKCTISNWYSTNDFRLEESISMLRFSTSRSTKILIVSSKLIHFVRKLICKNETL